MSSKSRNRRRKAAGAAPSRAVREQKRAQFEPKTPNKRLHMTLAAVALLVVAIVAAFVVMNRGGGQTATATTASAGGDVALPVTQVNDGKAHFYTYDAGGTQVKYFVLSSPDGTVRAALDACQVCYAQKKGYHQEGDSMVCNNCGRVFKSDQINVVTGGCNPIPLTRSIKGGKLTITAASLQAGAQYF